MTDDVDPDSDPDPDPIDASSLCDRCGDPVDRGYALDNHPTFGDTWVCRDCLKPWDEVLGLP